MGKSISYIFAFLIFATLLLNGCRKENTDNKFDDIIIGKWNWMESVGGTTGNIHLTPESTGINRELIFNPNKSLYIIHNQDTIEKTEYFFSKEKSVLLGSINDFLTIYYHINPNDNSVAYPMRYIINELNEENLIIQEDVYDGYLQTYKYNLAKKK